MLFSFLFLRYFNKLCWNEGRWEMVRVTHPLAPCLVHDMLAVDRILSSFFCYRGTCASDVVEKWALCMFGSSEK